MQCIASTEKFQLFVEGGEPGSSPASVMITSLNHAYSDVSHCIPECDRHRQIKHRMSVLRRLAMAYHQLSYKEVTISKLERKSSPMIMIHTMSNYYNSQLAIYFLNRILTLYRSLQSCLQSYNMTVKYSTTVMFLTSNTYQCTLLSERDYIRSCIRK